METTKDELAAQFEKLSNGALVKRVESGTMTPLAYEVACEELNARGVEFVSPNDQVDSQQQGGESGVLPEAVPPGVGFVTIAHLVNPLRANLLRAYLQSEGIVVHVLGEHLGVTHMFLSAGTGGIQVQVRSDQVGQAREMLAEFDRIEKEVQLPSDDEGSTEASNAQHDAGRHAGVADVSHAKQTNIGRQRIKMAVFLWFFAIGMAVLTMIVLISGERQ